MTDTETFRPTSRCGGGAALAALLLASGCHTFTLPEELEQRIAAESAGLTAIDDDEAVRRAGEDVASGALALPEALELPAHASLDDYVRLALERSPRIRARVRDLEALGQRVPQVTSLDDPRLRLMPPTGRMTQTAGGEMDAAIGLSQGLPAPGKRAARGKIAEQVVRVALENLRAERLAIVQEVKQAYFDHYLATVSLEVTDENLRLLQRLCEAAQARYAAGNAPQQDLLRAQVELYGASNERIALEQRRRSAAAHLNALMDRDLLARVPEPPALEPLGLDVRIEALMDRAVEHSPELAAAREQVRADLLAVRLARLEGRPDLDIGALFTFISSAGLSAVADGKDTLGIDIGLALPVRRARIRAGVLEHNAQVLAGAERYRDARNGVLLATIDLFGRVDAAHRSALLLRDGILPRARQAVAVSESGYQAGDVDFTTLIENGRRLLELTLAYHESLADLDREVAELERVIGTELERGTPAGTPEEIER